jgi:murein DD-endopeptidase MepM/ murein hydrolase activator NlpD
MADNIPSLEDLIKSIQEDGEDVPGLDDLLDDIRNEGEPQSSSALAVVPKKEDDLVEEEIDSQILSILGLEDVFDLTYEEYYRELRTAAAAGRMPGSRMSTESIELITEELKRVKGKTGRFKVKQKKIDINKVLDRKQPAPPGAIVKAEKLIPTAPEVEPEQPEKKTVVTPENLQNDLLNGIGNILESLITIRTVLQSQSKTDQQAAKEDKKQTDKKKKKERESTLEKKKPQSPILKALTKPVDDFFGAIKRFFTNVLLGSVVLGMFRWLKDPKNKEAIDGFANFFENNAGIILGGLLAIAALPIAATLLGLTKTVLGGVGLLGGALGSLGKFILGIPGVAPFLGMTVLAPLAGGLAAGAVAKFVAPAIMDAATKLDLGAAAAEDPLVRQAYSQLKEGGKAYKITTGRGGKKVRVEKSTAEMSAEEKKAFDDAREKEAKARELAVDFSRSNQDLYNLNQKLKDLQKEKPRNIPGGRTRTQADINDDIQNVKDQIKSKEKEKASKKKVLYDYLKIDSSKPQVQPQTPLMSGLPPSAAQPGTGPAGNQVGMPTKTITPTITGRYGEQRGAKTHGGTDLAVDDGTPLAALTDGQIIDSGRDPGGWGNFLVFRDNQGINHLYGHIQNGYKTSGNVKKGEVIAKVGMTGRTSGPHLHWESGTGWTGRVLTGKFDPLNVYSSSAPFTFDPSIETRLTKAQVAPITPSTPSIPSPTSRGNIVPLPIPTGGGQQQSQSNSAPLQSSVPRFSAEDPNNTTTMVVRAIYNIVG